MSDVKECPGCHVQLIVKEHSGGTPGGKDREYGHCPACGTLVVERVTSGLISVRLATSDNRKRTDEDYH